ncbi:MAG: 5'-methylthioadenosine/adenosylhomocysteine nucleosidase [Bacteroidia bacterium]|jgi:adenosylhomocysteine nucleosidase|nr:5'-methylthioadenosine/adenosylhomocysteine nucleosidase [Paludibacter sp.]MDD3489623.1 5'-methylthioadenosine/adenosylhomocysteine nucleosidase [Paludibacter sp.]NCB67915.1 5'-methylthioadenosine/adenosylhomocysteine nucleosidase [Bacteroidia bacterium]
MLLGIMGAMPEEMNKIIAAISNKEIIERGSRLYYRGQLFGQDVVAVFSRWGKVASAITTTNLILEFGVDRIVFTGVAGAISPDLNVGDIVIAQRLYQHDMDARPLMRRFEIPLTGKTSFEVPAQNVETMSQAVHNFLKNDKEFRKILSAQSILYPKMLAGDIASGDLFISSSEMKNALLRNLPSVVCAEMEGAAVAQVCDDYNIPLIVVRVISDSADEEAHTSAIGFVNQHAGDYSLAILREYISLLNTPSAPQP